MTFLRMAICPIAVLLVLLTTMPAAAQPSRGAFTHGTFAIANVSVISMTAEIVLKDTTVIIRDGRIANLGPSASVTVPPGMYRIDGRGKYLIPGLADMHVHLFSDDEDDLKPFATDELGVMLANGVTTIRLMIGTPEHLRLRNEIESGKILGPQLWIASPQFTGQKDANARVVKTADEARTAVKECADAGYDFIKLTIDITPEVFDAVVSEAARNGIRVVGHVDPRVGVAKALAAGQHIEHLDNYMESVIRDDSPIKTSVSDRGVFRPKNWESIDYIDDKKIAQIAEATARSRTWTCPTLTMFTKAFGLGQSDAEIRSRPDWAMQPHKHRELYLRGNERYWKTAASEARRKKYVETRYRMVKAISDVGGRILAGSDTPEWFLGYGFTLHRELESLVEAGLTPIQALSAATRNPAEFLHALSEWGTIEAGKRADLVMLSANPLEDIRNTTKIEGVCVGGKWLESAEMKRMIRTAADHLSGKAVKHD
jgi:imidazolonepropionase-like amidohydrolase